MPPENYRQLPKGVRCRCLKLWREADGSHWCCNPRQVQPEADNKIMAQPEWDAVHRFDADNNVEPARTIAYRIAAKYGHSATGRLVDEISHAIEDALELGQRRGRLIPPPR